MGIAVGKRLLKLSMFCVIIIVSCLVSNRVKTLLHPDVGGVLSDTGNEMEGWNARFLPQFEGIMANKSGMFILIIITHIILYIYFGLLETWLIILKYKLHWRSPFYCIKNFADFYLSIDIFSL